MARFDLGLSSEEFYGLQPRQLDALIKRWERSKQDAEFLSAQIASCVVNFSMAHPKEPVQPKDFMPSEWAKHGVAVSPREKQRHRQMVATEIRGVMAGLMRSNANG